MSSRDLNDLHPELKPKCEAFLVECEKRGLDILITCTYRSWREQNSLYAQGRSKPGAIVTKAKAGQSAHNFTIEGSPASKAFDIVPVRDGKLMWSDKHPDWLEAGKIGMDLGLNWYGRPGSSFREFPHFQLIEAIDPQIASLPAEVAAVEVKKETSFFSGLIEGVKSWI